MNMIIYILNYLKRCSEFDHKNGEMIGKLWQCSILFKMCGAILIIFHDENWTNVGLKSSIIQYHMLSEFFFFFFFFSFWLDENAEFDRHKESHDMQFIISIN